MRAARPDCVRGCAFFWISLERPAREKNRALVALRVHRLRVERRSEGLRGIVFSLSPIPVIGSIARGTQRLNCSMRGSMVND